MTTLALPCPPKSVWILPGDRVFAHCTDGWHLVDATTGKALGRWPHSETWVGAYSTDGSTLAIAEAANVRVIRARDGHQTATIATGARYTLAVAVDEGGGHVLAGGLDRQPVVFDAAGRSLATLASDFGTASAAAWSKELLAVATDDTLVRIYDRSWHVRTTIDDSRFATLALAWSGDGALLAIGRAGGVIDLVDTAGKLLQRFPARGDQVLQLMFAGHTLYAVHAAQTKGSAESIAWTLDGKPSPITERPAIGGGVVGGELWLASPVDGGVELWKRT